MMNYFEEQK